LFEVVDGGGGTVVLIADLCVVVENLESNMSKSPTTAGAEVLGADVRGIGVVLGLTVAGKTELCVDVEYANPMRAPISICPLTEITTAARTNNLVHNDAMTDSVTIPVAKILIMFNIMRRIFPIQHMNTKSTDKRLSCFATFFGFSTDNCKNLFRNTTYFILCVCEDHRLESQ
jgi:hypothetical protein